MSTHTPGPWRVGPFNLHVFADNARIGGDAMVCEIRGWGYLTGKGHGALGLSPEQAEEVQAANASLIAAAPDMLEALQACATILPRYHMAGKTTGEDEEHTAVLERVTDAIAKATPSPDKHEART